LPDFTVVSWDRRGLSRSPITEAALPMGLGVHADDVLRIIDAVSSGDPVFYLGSSSGALIGLELVSRHPWRVRRLIAHEPPISALLDDAQKVELVALQEEVERVHRTEGAPAAMAVCGRARRQRFLSVDAPAVRLYALDIQRLRPNAPRITVAVGASSRGTLHAAPALALARELDLKLVELPGGHGGYATHPRAFAAALRGLLCD
jgi:pimeloyl-ACP methyl ester carboxylesterase